jgi:hypothetical protein
MSLKECEMYEPEPRDLTPEEEYTGVLNPVTQYDIDLEKEIARNEYFN